MAKTPESVTETTIDPAAATDQAADPAATIDPAAAPLPEMVEATTWATEDELRAMLVTIEARNSELHRAELVAYLTGDYSLTFGKTEEWGVPFVRLMGIEAQSNTDDEGSLLSVWCMKARQAIMAGDFYTPPAAADEAAA